MNCDRKSNIKLSSNIIFKTKFDKDRNSYLPIDLLPKTYKDVRMKQFLSEEQELQMTKKLFWADKIVDSDDVYPLQKENIDKCKDCKYKDICY